MIKCPNKGLKAWQELEKAVGSNRAQGLWNKFDGETPMKFYVSPTDQTHFVVKNNGDQLNLTPEQKDSVYENYLNMMDRKREGKGVNRRQFDRMFKNMQVFNYKDSYIFGDWDAKNLVLQARLLSSPNVREMYNAVDILKDKVGFMASIPEDMGAMLLKKGMFKLEVNKEYNFKGEDMIKNLYFKNKKSVEEIFGKKVEDITHEDIANYDKFFNYKLIIDKMYQAYDNGEYTKLFPLMKELGLYDYNAYRNYKYFKNKDATPEELKSAIESIKRNADLNKINIDYTDLVNNPEVYQHLDTELNKLLVNYLGGFSIKTEMLDEMQLAMKIDSREFLDILNRTIYINKENQSNYPQQASRMIAYMMQHNPLVSETVSTLKRKPAFAELSQNELLDMVGDMIAVELHKKTETTIPDDLIDFIKNIIKEFFEKISGIRLDRINRNVAEIADNVLIQNKALITASPFKPGAYSKKTGQVNLLEAFEKDKFAADIADKMSGYFPLGGSAAMSEQGLILRPDENQVHDLDWSTDLPRLEGRMLFERIFPDAVYFREIYDEDSEEYTDSWMVVPDGYRIENMKYYPSEKVKVESFDIVDIETNEVVSVYNGANDKFTGSIEAKAIDIFSKDNGSENKYESFDFELPSGKTLSLSNWRNSFAAKQRYGRLKDIWDYNRFVPNEMRQVEDQNKIKWQPRLVNLDKITDEKSKKEAFVSVEQTVNTESLTPNFSTVNNQLLFGSEVKTIQSASDVLNNIINSNLLYNSERGTFFLQKAFNLLNKSGAKVHVISQESFNAKLDNSSEGTVMLYSATTNEIFVTEENLAKYNPNIIAEAFIHEVVHSTTVKAYFDPIGFEQHELKDFIDKAFTQYKYLGLEEDGEGNLMYGFENQAEFIAEIYSNPDFRDKIESLEKGWWAKFKDAVRRIFGLPKSDDQLINSAMLFETVEKMAEKDMSTWEGTIIEDERYNIFSKKEDMHTELTTIKDKIQHNINRINESLKINIDKYQQYANYYKDNENIKYYIDKLNKLKNEINSFNEANQIKGIVVFLEKMGDTLDYVEKKLDAIDHSNPENVKRTAKLQDQYLTTYSVIDDIKDLVAAISESDEDVLTQEELNHLNEIFDVRAGKFNRLNKRILELKKKVAKDLLTNIQYFPNIEKKHRDRLLKEYNANNISYDKELWISDKLNNRDKDIVQEDLNKEVRSFLNNPAFDVYASDVLFSSAINVSSPMVQIMYQLLNEIDNKRLEVERAKDTEFKELFNKLVAEKGTNNVNQLYTNIVQEDSNGQIFLKGEYDSKFYSDVHFKIKEMKRESNEKIKELELKKVQLSEDGKINSFEYKDLSQQIRNIKDKHDIDVNKIQRENLTYDDKGKINGIKDKWKNNTSNLSETEKKVLDFFIDIQNQAHKSTYGKDSIIKFTPGSYAAKFYELPRVTKSDTERMWQGDVKGTVVDQWKDLTTVRPDDVGFTSTDVDMKNEAIRSLKIHYRDRYKNFNNKDQSMDLFNVYRLEFKNGSAYKQRSEAETDLNFLLDIAKHQKYYEQKGTDVLTNRRNQKANLLEGDKSQTVKMLQNMLEMKLYDIHNKSNTKLANIDVNKAVNFINSASSFLTLSLNIASGTANVVNANAQLFLESFIKGHFIKAEGIKKANSIYAKDMMNNISDVTNGIKDSFTNQVLEMFNVKGDLLFSDANFLKSDLIKAGLNTDALRVFQESGEHWVQSVITMSVLDGIKVMSANNKYLNKEGNEVEKYSEAASLLDMLDKDENGIVQINPKVAYTTHSRMSKINEGGKEKIDMLVVKKINDSLGNYRKTDQAEMYRHWLGKLFGLYRRYLVPMGIARWRGIQTVGKSKEDLQDHEKKFSYALQEDEEGTYVTLLRYLITSLKSKQKWLALKTNWQNMSEYEKHNVKRAVTEAILTAAILPLACMFVGAAADDDDDNEFLYFIAYQLKRLDTELSAYRNLSEQFKMLRSPIPATRLIETVTQTLYDAATLNMFDEYEIGPHKGESKTKIRLMKQVPIVKDFLRSYKESFEFQSRSGGGSFGS